TSLDYSRLQELRHFASRNSSRREESKTSFIQLFTPCKHECPVCMKTVYLAEQLECDGKLYHKPCFKCKKCNMHLRLESYSAASDGIYCKVHYKLLNRDWCFMHIKMLILTESSLYNE
ncbi:unnamed protein product, partial [Soboliphyme baturini]|uniref:LIM zinc-binding domain-containing protein n=1 Tax=Soboliphyme baturini TaxID=241478 RepID=A0A183ITS1_9BILA